MWSGVGEALNNGLCLYERDLFENAGGFWGGSDVRIERKESKSNLWVWIFE